jgi:hypothetical protein
LHLVVGGKVSFHVHERECLLQEDDEQPRWQPGLGEFVGSETGFLAEAEGGVLEASLL